MAPNLIYLFATGIAISALVPVVGMISNFMSNRRWVSGLSLVCKSPPST